MPEGRYRVLTSGIQPPGSAVWYSKGFPPTNYSQNNASWPAKKIMECTDVVGNRDGDNGLTVNKIERIVTGITGAVVTTLNTKQYNNWMPPAVTESITHQVLSQPTLNSAVTMLMARTNPGRTAMSLPVAVGELRDLPRLVRQAGDIYSRYWRRGNPSPTGRQRILEALRNANDGAGLYLAYQFGVAPLISDVRKLLNFQAIQDRRYQELQRLYSGQGLKRRFTIWRGVVSENSNVNIATIMNETVAGRRSRNTGGHMWGTIRWKPTKPPPLSGRNDSLQLLARRVAFGANSINFVDAWNLMPWSWLIDWFSDTGTWLEANTQRIPASHSNINIMFERVTRVETVKSSHPTLTMPTSVVMLTTKERSPHSGFTLPEANLGPSLNLRQQSILSALGVTRHLRSRNIYT